MTSPLRVLVQPRNKNWLGFAGGLAGVRWQRWAICSCADPGVLAAVCGPPPPSGGINVT